MSKYAKGEYRGEEVDVDSLDVIERLRGYDWFQAFAYAPEGIERENVAEVLHAAEGERDADNWVLVARLKNGLFLYLSAGCDSTGWDCRSGGIGETRETLDAIIRECVTDDDARRLNITR